MKKTIVAVVLAMSAALAWAIPAPAQIESALAAHDYQSARSMTDEVLRAKPDSAKAHLFNAYVLLHTGNKGAASEELKTAARLDSKGDVKGSALFGRTVAELQTAPQTAPVASPLRQAVRSVSYAAPAYQSPPASSNAVWYVFGLIAVGGVAIFVFRPRATTSPHYSYAVREAAESAPARPTRRVQRSYVPESETVGNMYPRVPVAPVYQAPQPVYQQPTFQQPVQSGGMGMMGTAASVAGGVVAGNVISDMLHSGHRSSRNRDDDEYEARRRRERDADTYSAPAPVYEAPSPRVDYDSDRSSYSSGGDSSWGGSSSSSSDSSSSSSSWDSGSSSSDSSSGGSDW